MREETLEWIQKAEGDFASATREVRARKNKNNDSACFHSQQCIEKFLKAILVESDIPFPKTHDLGALLNLAIAKYPELDVSREDMDLLTDYAIVFRYPGECATEDQAHEAYSKCSDLRQCLRKKLAPAN
jgi:HEPN domain-containing protein